MHRSIVVALSLLAFSTACAHGDQEDTASASGASRSQACLSFQKAYCAWDADKCHTHDRATCDDTATALYCTTDDKANACIGELPAASCSGLPSACTGVVDAKPAIAACNALLDAYCTATDRCGQSKKDACMTSAAAQLDCAAAIGAGPTIDNCYSDLKTVDCPSLALALPASCTHVIKVSTPSPTPGARLHAPTSEFAAAADLR